MILKLSTDRERDVKSLMLPILEYIGAQQLKQDFVEVENQEAMIEETPEKNIEEVKETKNKHIEEIESSGTQEEEKEEIPQVYQEKEKDIEIGTRWGVYNPRCGCV